MSPYTDLEAKRQRDREYYAKHADRIKARVKMWVAENPDRRTANQRRYEERNRADIIDRAKARRHADPEAYAAYYRELRRRRLIADEEYWRARARETSARRRARVRGVFVESVDPWLVFERDEGVCGICDKPVDKSDWHLDHIIPLARGGEHSYANVQVSHPSCNRRKWAH